MQRLGSQIWHINFAKCGPQFCLQIFSSFQNEKIEGVFICKRGNNFMVAKSFLLATIPRLTLRLVPKTLLWCEAVGTV
jgi:hypothetical protein